MGFSLSPNSFRKKMTKKVFTRRKIKKKIKKKPTDNHVRESLLLQKSVL